MPPKASDPLVAAHQALEDYLSATDPARGVPEHQRNREWLRLTVPMQLDFRWWQRAARYHNGKATILQRPEQTVGHLFTDASDEGFGGFVIDDLETGAYATFSFSWDDKETVYALLDDDSKDILKHDLWPVRPPPGTDLTQDWLICRRELFALLVAQLLWKVRFWGPWGRNQIRYADLRFRVRIRAHQYIWHLKKYT